MAEYDEDDRVAGARIRAWLRRGMDERDVSQAEFCRRAGTDDGNLTRILKGERIPRASFILKMSRVLNYNATRILEEDPEAKWFDDGVLPWPPGGK